jgi:hypothetical protein
MPVGVGFLDGDTGKTQAAHNNVKNRRTGIE